MKSLIIILPVLALTVMACIHCSKMNRHTTHCDISGTYKLPSLAQADPLSRTDLFRTLPTCVKEDFVQLKTDNTYSNTAADQICNLHNDDAGNWNGKAEDCVLIESDASTIDACDVHQLVLVQLLPQMIMNTNTMLSETYTKQ